MRNRRILALLLCSWLGLWGCGQKGPLYLPEQAPTNQEQPETEDDEQQNNKKGPTR